jgi:hypothetical protein
MLAACVWASCADGGFLLIVKETAIVLFFCFTLVFCCVCPVYLLQFHFFGLDCDLALPFYAPLYRDYSIQFDYDDNWEKDGPGAPFQITVLYHYIYIYIYTHTIYAIMSQPSFPPPPQAQQQFPRTFIF